MRKCAGMLLALLAVVPTFAQVPEGNLVKNPGFEEAPAAGVI